MQDISLKPYIKNFKKIIFMRQVLSLPLYIFDSEIKNNNQKAK